MANAGRVLIIPKGEYSSTELYEQLDMVLYKNESWICKEAVTGKEPSESNSDYWHRATNVKGLLERETSERKSADEVEKAERESADAIEKAERIASDAVLHARMDAFTTLKEGSTTGDAELIDGRTDYEGKTWDNLGAHLRGVSSQLSSEIDKYKYKNGNVVENNVLLNLESVTGTIVDSRITYSIIEIPLKTENGKNYYLSYEGFVENTKFMFAMLKKGDTPTSSAVDMRWKNNGGLLTANSDGDTLQLLFYPNGINGGVLGDSVTFTNICITKDYAEIVAKLNGERWNLSDSLFRIGDMRIENSQMYYVGDSPNRVCTKDFVELRFRKGDKVFIDFPVTRMHVFYSTDGFGTVVDGGWVGTDYTIPQTARYKFVLSKVVDEVEVPPTVIDEFSNCLKFQTENTVEDMCQWEKIYKLEEKNATIAKHTNYDDSTRVTEFVDKVKKSVDGNCLIFAQMTDTHYGYGDPAKSSESIAHHQFNKLMRIAQDINADFVIHTGDLIQGKGSEWDSEHTDVDRFNWFFSGISKYPIPFFYVMGTPEHDRGIRDDEYNYTLSKGNLKGLASRFTKGINCVYGDSSKMYYYFDLDLQNVRCIVLDGEDNTDNTIDGTMHWGFSNSQSEWFERVLDTSKNIVVFCHIPPLTGLLATGSVENYGGLEIVNAMNDFTKNGGTILAYIYGHMHSDNTYYDSENKILYQSLTCSLRVTNQDTSMPSLGTKVIPGRTNDGSVTDEAIDVYVMNVDTKTIKTFRYGSGSDRTQVII